MLRVMNHATSATPVSLFGGELTPFVRSEQDRSARRGRRYPQGPAGGSCCVGRRCAPTALRCSLWDRAAELTALTSFAAYKQPRRVRCGCALRAPIPETALLAVTEIAPRRPLRVAPAARQQLWSLLRRKTTLGPRALVYWFSVPENRTVPARQAAPGGGPAGAISGATSSAGLESARASAHPHLTLRACLSVVSAANEASSRRDSRPSSTVQSARSADRPSMSPRRAPAGCRLSRQAKPRQRQRQRRALSRRRNSVPTAIQLNLMLQRPCPER